jgi:hypothetical protein
MTIALKSPTPHAAEVAAVVKALTRTAALWGLRNADAADLMDVPIATWNRMKAGRYRGTLDRDKTMRAGLIIGIFKGLRLLFNGPLEYGWPLAKNGGPLYEGRSPVEFMISGGMPAMMRVRDHVDAMRGGL